MPPQPHPHPPKPGCPPPKTGTQCSLLRRLLQRTRRRPSSSHGPSDPAVTRGGGPTIIAPHSAWTPSVHSGQDSRPPHTAHLPREVCMSSPTEAKSRFPGCSPPLPRVAEGRPLLLSPPSTPPHPLIPLPVSSAPSGVTCTHPPAPPPEVCCLLCSPEASEKVPICLVTSRERGASSPPPPQPGSFSASSPASLLSQRGAHPPGALTSAWAPVFHLPSQGRP